MGRVRTHQNYFFLFSLFLGLSQLILVGKVVKMVVFSFFNFFCYFLEFSITSRVGTHMNDFYFFLFFFSLFLGLPLLILAWKEATMVFFNFFFNFFLFFLIFNYGSGRNSSERFFFFSLTQPFPTYFLSFSAFPDIFSLEKKP